METVRLLIIEDNPVDALCLKEALEESKGPRFAITHVETLAEAKECLGKGDFHTVVLDLGLPDSQGIETFMEVQNSTPHVPIVVLSGLDDETLAIEAVKLGAQDYLCKDQWNPHLISRSLAYAIERRQILNELRKSEERFRAIFEGSGDAIWIKDTNLRLTHVNPAMANVFGCSSHELIGLKDSDLFDGENAHHFRELDLRVLAGDPLEEQRTVSIDGNRVLWNIAKVPMRDFSGKIVSICGIARNVTDWQQQQKPISKGRADCHSKTMKSALKTARIAAEKDSIILLLGESGSGKDYLAKYIHDHSRRANGPYFSVNCAAIAPDLAESELFGHEKGSFTGAGGRKRGLLELAEGGTLLLNEIGDLALRLQSKLLTFLDTRKFTRVGGEREITVNARLISATNRDLRRDIEAGRFRQDLFYRINVLSIEVPPLRKRLEDLPALVQEILSKIRTELQLQHMPIVDHAALDALRRYDWPGNVRELRNVLERAVILTDGEVIGPRQLGLEGLEQHSSTDGLPLESVFLDGPLDDCINRLAKAKCKEALRLSGGNKKKAALMLGIARDTLYRYLDSLGITREDYK